MNRSHYLYLILVAFSFQINASERLEKDKESSDFFMLPISIGESSDVTVNRKYGKSFAGYLGVSLIPNLNVLRLRPLVYVRAGTETPLFLKNHDISLESGLGFLYAYSKNAYFKVTIGRQLKPDNFLDSDGGGWKSTKGRFTYNRFFPKSRAFIWNVGVLFEKAKYDNNDEHMLNRSRAGVEFGLGLVL